jgi:hypothetical protein
MSRGELLEGKSYHNQRAVEHHEESLKYYKEASECMQNGDKAGMARWDYYFRLERARAKDQEVLADNYDAWAGGAKAYDGETPQYEEEFKRTNPFPN